MEGRQCIPKAKSIEVKSEKVKGNKKQMAILITALLVAISLWLPPSLSLSLSGPIYEKGYSVKTVLQAYKLGIKPYHICADVTGNYIFVLDSINNNIHKFSLPLSEGSSMDLVAGSSKGKAGYVDGEPQLSLFDTPRSLAIDSTGNLYIADKNNHAVRKCTHKGITTIAGGNKAKTGHNDGPGENATFSFEFNVHYVFQMDSILVTDIGNKMIRRIYLDYSSNEMKLTQSVKSGYVVETIFDGQKLDIIPSSVSNSMKGNDLFLLDKAHSNISKLSLPLSQRILWKAGIVMGGLMLACITFIQNLKMIYSPILRRIGFNHEEDNAADESLIHFPPGSDDAELCIGHENDLIDLNKILDEPNDLVGSNTTEEGSVSSDHHAQDKIDRMREKYVENFIDESRQV